MLRLGQVVFGLVVAAALMRCGTESNPVAPYEGQRPLEFLAVTQSFTPDLQWTGGRVAAVGVNRDSTAALGSTLVWAVAAEGNTIGYNVTVGDGGSGDFVAQYGGTLLDSLEDGKTYTFWIAEKEVVDARLDPSSFDGLNFVDTTITMDLELDATGPFGGVGRKVLSSMQVIQDQRLQGTRTFIRWEPADVVIRELAICEACGTGGYTNLKWHVVMPDSLDGFTSPVVVGELPEGAQEGAPWTGFRTSPTDPPQYTIWMATDEWDGRSFSFATDGLAYVTLRSSNFE